MQKLQSLGKHLAAALAAVFLTCLFPCVFIYTQNAGEARAKDMLVFLGIFCAVALAGMVLSGILFRNLSRAGFVTCLGMLIVINFGMLSDAVFDAVSLRPTYLLVILCALLALICILLLWKKPDMTIPCVLIAIAFGALCLMNFFMAVPTLLSSAGNSHEGSDITEEMPVLSGEKRNVYYLLFDEYGGDINLDHYFGYDNSEFLSALQDMGFSVSHSTFNTESCWTDTLIPNLLNLDYVCDDSMTELARREYLTEPYLFRLFRANGYQVNLINHRAFLHPEGTTELSSGQREDNISEYLLERSIFNKIDPIREKINVLLWRNYRDQYEEPLNNCFEALSSCRTAAADQPTLTVSYIQCPHAPFLYDAEGNVTETADRWNWKSGNFYPDQLTWLNDQLLPVLTDIRENDPEAVIILLSDHGARVPLHMVEQYGGPRFDAERETYYMQNALCCVYVPDESLEIEGDTGINATRKALNSAFDTGLPLLDAPEGYVLSDIFNAKE